MQETEHRGRILLPLLYVVLCPFIPISVRFLAGHIDNLGQNVLRMGAGAIVLSAVSLVKHRSELTELLTSARTMAVLFFIGAASVLCVYATVEGVAATSATMAHVVGSIGIPLTVVLAALLFQDERLITWNKSFILGMLIGDRLTLLQVIFGALVVIGSAISFSSSARSR